MSYLPQSDLQYLGNVLAFVLNDYDVQKAKNEIVEWNSEDNYKLLQMFLTAKKVQGCTDRTIEYYCYTLKHFLDSINIPLAAVDVMHIRYYIANREVKDHVSKCTQNNEARCISSLFSWLTNEEYINKNPMLRLGKIKEPKKKKKAFSSIEIEKMRSKLETGMDRAIFEILLSTGCRVSELCNIRRDELNGDEVAVRGKGNKERTVYLNAKSMLAADNYLKERSDDNPYLFPRMKSIEEMHTPGVKRIALKEWYKNPSYVDEDGHMGKGTVECKIRELGKSVDVKAHPHKFRRTCATNALMRGMPLLTVSKMLGHNNVGTTQIYLDLNEDEVKAAHKKYADM